MDTLLSVQNNNFSGDGREFTKASRAVGKPRVIYTDNSLEFGTSCEESHASTPHERAVRRMKEGHLQHCCNLSWMKNGGLALWSVTGTCEMSNTPWPMGRMFMTSSMKADIHLGPNYLSNSEIHKNTKFEDIESVFNITQKLVREHSEEILLIMKSLEYSCQAIKWAKAKVRVYAESVQSDTRSNRIMEGSSGRTQVVFVLPRCSGYRSTSN